MFGTTWDDPRTMANLQMAAGLLAAGGPSERPVNLGMGLLGGLDRYQAVLDAAKKQKMLEEDAAIKKSLAQAQIEKYQADALRAKAMADKGMSPDDPSAVREWIYFNSLSPENKQRYLELKRQTWDVKSVAGVPTLVGKLPGFGQVPLTTLKNQAGGEAVVAGAKAAASERGKAENQLVKTVDPITGMPVFRQKSNVSDSNTPVFTLEAAKPKIEAETTTSRADAERMINARKTISMLDSAIGRRNSVIADLNQLLPNLGMMSTGLIGKATQGIPTTPAYDAKKLIDSIKARIGFGELSQMRLESPTGGALGQVAVQELEALQNSLGSLDIGQSENQLRSEISKIIGRYNGAMNALQRALSEERKFLFNRGNQPNAPQPAASQDPLGIR